MRGRYLILRHKRVLRPSVPVLALAATKKAFVIPRHAGPHLCKLRLALSLPLPVLHQPQRRLPVLHGLHASMAHAKSYCCSAEPSARFHAPPDWAERCAYAGASVSV